MNRETAVHDIHEALFDAPLMGLPAFAAVVGPEDAVLWIEGVPPRATKKNDLEIRKWGRRHSVGHSKEYNRWEEDAVLQLRAQWGAREPFDLRPRRGKRKAREHYALNCAIFTYLKERSSPDASNLYEAPQDALEAAGVLSNDYHVVSHDGSRRLRDPNHSRILLWLRRLT